MKCPNCGSEQGSQRFCGECGCVVSRGSAAATEQPAPAAAEMPSQPVTPPAQSYTAPPAQNFNAQPAQAFNSQPAQNYAPQPESANQQPQAQRPDPAPAADTPKKANGLGITALLLSIFMAPICLINLLLASIAIGISKKKNLRKGAAVVALIFSILQIVFFGAALYSLWTMMQSEGFSSIIEFLEQFIQEFIEGGNLPI